MKYSKDERIDIGRQVVTQELTRLEAMTKYAIGNTSMDRYIQLYLLSFNFNKNKEVGLKELHFKNYTLVEATV